jgi:hypothetical protein
MKATLVVLAVLGAACAGCATEPQPPVAGASAGPSTLGTIPAPSYVRSRPALTGSRFAPLDDDDLGSNSVSAVTGEEYMRMDAGRMKQLCHDGPCK